MEMVAKRNLPVRFDEESGETEPVLTLIEANLSSNMPLKHELSIKDVLCDLNESAECSYDFDYMQYAYKEEEDLEEGAQLIKQVVSTPVEAPDPYLQIRESGNLPGKLYLQPNIEYQIIESKQCNICKKLFNSRLQLAAHMRLYLNREAYRCPICNFTFHRKSSCESHIASHSDIRPFKCSFCPKSYSLKPHYDRHVLAHCYDPEGSILHPCSMCDRSFSKKVYLDSHVKLTHQDLMYKCDYCKKLFFDKKYLEGHIQIHLTQDPGSTKLDKSSRYLTSMWKKGYKCQICGKVLNSRSNMYHCIYKHTKAYQCQQCERVFTCRKVLDRHVKSSHPPYECSHCDISFDDQNIFRKHLRMHPKKQRLRYGCEPCKKSFTSRFFLESHNSQHHAEKVSEEIWI